MISFTDEQLKNFSDARHLELAQWCWREFTQQHPWRLAQLELDESQGIAHIKEALEKSETYLVGTEADRDYNKWRIVYAELAFLVGWSFDTNKWTQSVLTETIWHPFLRLDILFGVYEICFNNPENIQFFEQLAELAE